MSVKLNLHCLEILRFHAPVISRSDPLAVSDGVGGFATEICGASYTMFHLPPSDARKQKQDGKSISNCFAGAQKKDFH